MVCLEMETEVLGIESLTKTNKGWKPVFKRIQTKEKVSKSDKGYISLFIPLVSSIRSAFETEIV